MRSQPLICLLFLLQLVAGVRWGTFRRNPGAHDVTGNVRLLNKNTIQLENFNFDGRGFTVYAYYFRPGQYVDRTGGGVVIPVPGGKPYGEFPLGWRYVDRTIVLTMPEGTDVCDIGTLTIWCQPAQSIFNDVTLTRQYFDNYGADPCTVLPQYIEQPLPDTIPAFDNCLFLDPSLQLRWLVNREESNVAFELCGCLSSSPDVNQYMAFGVSGSNSSTLMFGADPTVTWIGADSVAKAVDYHLSGYTQCVTDEGACPDSVYNGCTNDASLIIGIRSNNQQCVVFTRPFIPSDVVVCDRPLNPDDPTQHIVWGVGALGGGDDNPLAFRHFLRAKATDGPVHLGRDPVDECGNTKLVCQTCQPYRNHVLVARGNATFRAVIGPSGDERGYVAITGLPSWGIAFYINGTLIPELVVQRGSTYTFIVEGGDNPTIESAYHPLYITSSNEGSRLSESQAIRNREVVYAGFTEEGNQVTGVGRLCELKESPSAIASRTSCQNLDDYITKLEEGPGCSEGQPGTLTWTPDESTPDVVYYQCATHKNLGWRIHVLNEGDPIPTFGGAPPTHAVTAVSVLLCVGVALLFAALN